MDKVKIIVNLTYREIAERGYFNMEEGNKLIPLVWNEAMSNIPEKMTDYINECGLGNCFIFSAYMIRILELYNINTYMVVTLEDEGLRASVMYENDGKFYIANPVEDIEYFTENGIKPIDRHNYYIGKTAMMKKGNKIHNDSHYTVEEFTEKYGQIWVLGKMNHDEKITLVNAINTRTDRCIAPPEEANLDIGRLVK